MTASQAGFFNLQSLTDLGALAVGGKLYTYTYGTTTHKIAYTDAAGSVAHTYTSDGAGGQYIALNARGELPAPLYLTAGSYDIAYKTSAGATVWTRRADPVSDVVPSVLIASSGSSLVGFLQAGTGAVARTAQAKMRERLTPQDFGAVGDGATNDAAALSAVLAEHNISGIPIDLGSSIYAISAVLSQTFTRKAVILGDGATIKLTSGANIARAVDLTVNQYGADLRGWTVDANNKAYNGLVITNTLTADMTQIGDLYAEDIRAVNVYRSGLTFSGGFGIWVSGGFNKVHFVRPRIVGVKLATGAGIVSVIGVHGLVVLQSGSAEARFVTIDDPYIENVYSEDPAWLSDQDGIQLFGLTPSVSVLDISRVDINGGTFKNCWGRSIKAARRNVHVNGAHFVRTSGWTGGRGLMEIDFAYSDGTVRDISYFHEGFSVEKIVSGSIGTAVSEGLLVDGCRGYATAASPVMDSVVLRTGSGAHQATRTVVRNLAHRGRFMTNLVAYDTNLDNIVEYLTVEDCAVETVSDALVKVQGGTARMSINRNTHGGSAALEVVNPAVGSVIWEGGRNMSLAARTFTGTMTGLTTSPTGVITCTRSGDVVSLDFPVISGTSNTTACTITGAPASFWPTAARLVAIRGIDNGAFVAGWAQVETSGVITLYPNVGLGAWTAAGTKGISVCTISYKA